MEKLVKQILGRGGKVLTLDWPKNWMIKLLSFLFAFFLWYFVVGEDKVDITVYIPIEIVNMPRDLVISNQFKKQLEVTVSGPRGLIRGISSQHISRPVDLSEATPGTVVVRNDPDSIPFPRGIRVLRIQPTHIILLLDRLIQKELPLEPVLNGSPAAGFEVASVVLDPPSLTVTGPQTVLADQDVLHTHPIDVSGLQSSVLKPVTLDLAPAIADLIGEPVASARITVKEKTATKTIDKVPVSVHPANGPAAARLKPATVTVKAALPLSLIKKTGDLRSLLSATINIEGLKAGRYELPVQIEPAHPFRVLTVEPAKVTVEIPGGNGSNQNPAKK